MSTVLNRLRDTQNLAQIVPENKGELVPPISQSSASYYILVGLGALILISLVVIAIIKHRRRHYRYRS